MSGPSIILRPSPLDILDDFHNTIRKRRKLREQPKTYDCLELWECEARRRFGAEKRLWRWLCHHCKRTFSTMDYVWAGAPQSAIGVACIGAFEPLVECSYDGTKLQPGNPITVHFMGQRARMLAFAD
jgi:hypothetical protein